MLKVGRRSRGRMSSCQPIAPASATRLFHEKLTSCQHLFQNSREPPEVLLYVHSRIQGDVFSFAQSLINTVQRDRVRLTLYTNQIADSMSAVVATHVPPGDQQQMAESYRERYVTLLQSLELQTHHPRLPVFHETLFLPDGGSFRYEGKIDPLE